MKQPGLDDRHRDKNGEISQKHGNTRNGNLPRPIQGFSDSTTISEMRRITGETSEAKIRKIAKEIKRK